MRLDPITLWVSVGFKCRSKQSRLVIADAMRARPLTSRGHGAWKACPRPAAKARYAPLTALCFFPDWFCGSLRAAQHPFTLDDHSKVVPLLPIPNRTVKRLRADDSGRTSVKVGHRQALIKTPHRATLRGSCAKQRAGGAGRPLAVAYPLRLPCIARQ